jgi:hypothetical protein
MNSRDLKANNCDYYNQAWVKVNTGVRSGSAYLRLSFYFFLVLPFTGACGSSIKENNYLSF